MHEWAERTASLQGSRFATRSSRAHVSGTLG